MEKHNITTIRTSKGDISIDVLMAKIGIVQTVIGHTTDYVEKTRSSCKNIFIPPDSQVLLDAKAQLDDVYFALKCVSLETNTPVIITETHVTDLFKGDSR